ncbi:Valine--tRNA ligase [bacterium HR34]|nr:Valine--tRNA ligase [bacterium HR34]
MELAPSHNPKDIEEKIYNYWLKLGYFNPDKQPDKEKRLKKGVFSITMPPPNITGELHMGHALNATISDILIRKKMMEGFLTVYVPGTDHAGIATQNVVEKNLKKQGISRFDLGREKFIEKVWEWVEKYKNIILTQIKKLGVAADWSRKRFTLDKNYEKAVNYAFKYYFEKGLIYKGKRVVNWCKRCKTSLSDLELEYEKEFSYLWYIKYPVKDSKEYIVVATSRPETMLGDEAVAVHPKDERYKNLSGKKVVLPLVKKEIPIIRDNLVDKSFGTGVVKVTPAHSLVDYKISLKHKLPLTQVINEEGQICPPAPEKYIGLNVQDARILIIEDLKKQGFLEKEEPYEHNIPVCYRCGTKVEFVPSNQWFLKMDELAKKALEAIKKEDVKIIPNLYKRLAINWLKNIQDWCISRQIWWGHKIPIEECACGFFYAEKPTNKVCKKCGKERVPSEDVLDTWFSSALWPFAVFGWPKRTKDLKTFYPTSLIVTAQEILYLWIVRMIFSGLEFIGKVPFYKVLISQTVVTKDGKRMSKSLGTGVNPLDFVEKYGADATRFGIAFKISKSKELRFDETAIITGKKFCNKIWNSVKFVLFQIERCGLKEVEFNSQRFYELSKEDKAMIKKFIRLKKNVEENIENFEIGKATRDLYEFYWHYFCDKYIEYSKKVIEKNKEKQIKNLLYIIIESLKMLHPIMPHITEELYRNLPLKNKKKSIIFEKW